jgi:CDP-diacylglycerol---serine O-phosphatidyltransferase
VNSGLPRPSVRRAVVLFPSGLTLGNLFFGVFAIVTAARGDYTQAGWYVVLGGVCDLLDGRVARATNTGGPFGAELDSLVDVVTFGLAPALIMYFAVFNRDGWDWLFCFVFVACAVLRLARFNVEQAGKAKTYFQGLPTPAAGLTLSTYYWFSQTPLYQQTAIADISWHVTLRFLMIGLSLLMISNVPYPVLPNIGFRTVRGVVGTILVGGGIIALIKLPNQFFFPAAVAYAAFGLARASWLGLLERRAGGSTAHAERLDASENGDFALRDEEVGERWPRRKRRRRRGHRGERPGQPHPTPPSSVSPPPRPPGTSPE